MSNSLVSMAEATANIERLLIESSGEITPEIEQLLQVKEIGIPEKVDSYSMVMARMETLVDFYKERASLFLGLSKAADTVVDRLKENLKYSMQELSVTELTGNDIKFKLVKSNPSVTFEDESKIPDSYKTVETIVKVDKKRVADDLKIGVPVPGASLKQSESLRQYANTPGGRK